MAAKGDLACAQSAKAADPTKVVAGRTLSGWVKDFDSQNELVRLRAVKSLGPFGESAVNALAKCLDDSSDGVKDWAADHLGAIGKSDAKHPEAKQVIARLRNLESQKQKAVAAAYALCRLDAPDGHISLLVERLGHPERGMACSAAEFLGKMGPSASAALKELESHFQLNRDYHVKGACQNAIRKIKQLPVK